VLDGREPLDGAAADALRRRVEGDELRVLGFQALELVKQLVEHLVRDLRSVVHVVLLLVTADGVAKLMDSAFEIRHFHAHADSGQSGGPGSGRPSCSAATAANAS